jgi:UrcA family protein
MALAIPGWSGKSLSNELGVEIMTKILIAACVALLGSASVAQPPLIVSKTNAPIKVVSYGDLNLASVEGQDRLSSRIRSAARSVCFENNIEQVKFTVARRHCYDSAMSDASRQMSEAIAQAKTGTVLAAATLTVRGQ